MDAERRRAPKPKRVTDAETERYASVIPSILDGTVPLDGTARDVVQRYFEGTYRAITRAATEQ